MISKTIFKESPPWKSESPFWREIYVLTLYLISLIKENGIIIHSISPYGQITVFVLGNEHLQGRALCITMSIRCFSGVWLFSLTLIVWISGIGISYGF